MEAELSVLPDLPAHARVGMFGAPATYRAYVRFSNGACTRQSDRKPDVRGVAIKVARRRRQEAHPGNGETRARRTSFSSRARPRRFATPTSSWVRTGRAEAGAPPAARDPSASESAARSSSSAASSRRPRRPIGSLATTRYFSALPIQVGAPRRPLRARAPRGSGRTARRRSDDLGAELAGPTATGAGVLRFRVQFYVDRDAGRRSRTPPWSGARGTLPSLTRRAAHARETGRLVASRDAPRRAHRGALVRSVARARRVQAAGQHDARAQRGLSPQHEGAGRRRRAGRTHAVRIEQSERRPRHGQARSPASPWPVRRLLLVSRAANDGQSGVLRKARVAVVHEAEPKLRTLRRGHSPGMSAVLAEADGRGLHGAT